MEKRDTTYLWDAATQLLKAELTDTSFETWFSSLLPAELQDGTLTLLAQNDFQLKMLNDRYRPMIETALSRASGHRIQLQLMLASQFLNNSETLRQNAASNVITPFPMLNPRYTFSSFVIGNSNRFAHAAAQAVASSLGKAYNPLFLYSGVGLGKTHLMHAIGHETIKRIPDAKVMYITSENFTNQMITAISENKNNEFRNRFRSVDLLMIDDIQFIAGKEQTQEEFFHTFNALHEAGKQIIISSDKQPKEIPTLEERLRSRFEWGLIADIAKPDYETRIAILRRKADVEGQMVPDEVVSFIASQVESNIRELEGSLNRVVAFAQLNKRPIDLEITHQALKETILIKDPRRITIDLVIAIVAEFFGVSVEDIKSKKRNREISVPRHVAMYLSRDINGASLPRIGAEFGGRDHTTVIHAIEKTEKDIKADAKFDQTVQDLKKRILGS